MKDSEVKARREKVMQYMVKDMSESHIAELLGVHRNTVVRDVVYIRGTAKGWLDDLAMDGFT